jgi:hypothetical protein
VPNAPHSWKREVYASSNGDRWYLARDSDTGQVFIQHVPNAASGGDTRHVEIGVFLGPRTRSPEQQALLQLIGTLVDDRASDIEHRPTAG